MSTLSPLLELQDLDVAADAARRRSASLPERASIPIVAAALAGIEARLVLVQEDRAARELEEEQIGLEVSQIVRDIEAAEVERYSGKRKNQDEASAHKASQKALHERQAALEEREMEILEIVEDIDDQIEKVTASRAANRVDAEKVAEAIRKVESEVLEELTRLTSDKSRLAETLPDPILTAYERVRGQPQKSGRGAALLEENRCGGCQIKLPSLEKSRMLAEPPEALIQCPQCRRVLVRSTPPPSPSQ